MAPRYSPGVQPAARRIFWPKVLVLRAQLLLLGSVWMSCLLFIVCQCLYSVFQCGIRETDRLGAARPILNPKSGYHTDVEYTDLKAAIRGKFWRGLAFCRCGQQSGPMHGARSAVSHAPILFGLGNDRLL